MTEYDESLQEMAARLQAYYDRPGRFPGARVEDVSTLGAGTARYMPSPW